MSSRCTSLVYSFYDHIPTFFYIFMIYYLFVCVCILYVPSFVMSSCLYYITLILASLFL